jgi:hypothetical protein
MELSGDLVYRGLFHLAYWATFTRLWLGHRIPFFAKVT